MARGVGKWVVFLYSEFSPGVYAPDDPDARGGDGDTGGESLILSFRAWIASCLAMTGTDFLDHLRSYCSFLTHIRDDL